jgi:hypothetical protein
MGRNAPLAAQHGTLVFADALTERAAALRVWMSPTHEDRAIPDLRAMLDLPLERVIISHGEPVHARNAFKRALELPQWPAGPLHLAAYRGNLYRVRTVVEAGADLTARDERFGATALEWATTSSFPTCNLSQKKYAVTADDPKT